MDRQRKGRHVSKQDQPRNIQGGDPSAATLASLADLGARLADQTEPQPMQAAVLAEALKMLGVDGGAIALWED
ncbi:MAG: hypothetical protein RBS99_19380, partial [Rhodospirillales bacterium]|nr:hypothetical protein [Rhodospirillales bacterium]